MRKMLIALPLVFLLSVPVYAQDDRLDALDFWAVETFEDADKVCEFYATYSDYEYILSEMTERDWDHVEEALRFYDEYSGYDLYDSDGEYLGSSCDFSYKPTESKNTPVSAPTPVPTKTALEKAKDTAGTVFEYFCKGIVFLVFGFMVYCFFRKGK